MVVEMTGLVQTRRGYTKPIVLAGERFVYRRKLDQVGCLLVTLLVLMLCIQSSLSGQEIIPAQPVRSASPGTDWLLSGEAFEAGVSTRADKDEITLSNGLISRTFRITPNAATISFEQLVTGESLIRGVKPEALVMIDSVSYEIGGLKGQPNYAFLRDGDIERLYDSSAFVCTGYELMEVYKPFDWKKVRHHDSSAVWPPKGIHLRFDYHGSQHVMPEHSDIRISIHYELYDGIPVMTKWMTVENGSTSQVVINDFTSEILAAVEYGSVVDARKEGYVVPPPNIHIETDYSFASFDVDHANHHVVHWLPDPDYSSQVNYLLKTPCLLHVSPELGPEKSLVPGESLQTFRTYILPFDSYDRERNGLAMRRMYRTLMPWTSENPLMMHARFADWEQVKNAIDQCAEVGFEMVILTFGSGFNIEDDSEEYLAKMKSYAEYAHEKGVEIGGYSLLASRTIDQQTDVILPDGMSPTFGNSPCLGSEWSELYFDKLYHFYETSGFTLLEHDGSYPGDPCMSHDHPGHRGFLDSRWEQFRVIRDYYRWCREQGVYLNVPDYYYANGSNKCSMGYREVNWSLPRDQQVLHTRQNIFDGTWTRTPSMGWMFVPLTEYHGGGAAATIEPLNEHLDHYRKMMISNLGAGVQACYRGPRLFDTEETMQMVKESVDWFKQHREVLEGDIIHLRRADGRDLDYWLNVNPGGEEKGMLLVFNPLGTEVEKEISVPLYYTGLQESVVVCPESGDCIARNLNRDYTIKLKVKVAAGTSTWYVFK